MASIYKPLLAEKLILELCSLNIHFKRGKLMSKRKSYLKVLENNQEGIGYSVALQCNNLV